jgi:hypothetical protein
METFKNTADYHNYSVSNFGRVRNDRTGRIMTNVLNSLGYHVVTLSKNGKAKNFGVHRLMAIAFIENVHDKICVDHINNIRCDNRLENLRWATFVENAQNVKLLNVNKSGVKGVFFDNIRNKWKVGITINGKSKHIGYYTNIEDAKKARRQKALEIFGEFINDCEK